MIPDVPLGGGVGDWAQKGQAATLSVDGMLAGRERDEFRRAPTRVSQTLNPMSLWALSGPPVKLSSASASLNLGWPCRSV